MSESEEPNFARRAAKASCVLAVVNLSMGYFLGRVEVHTVFTVMILGVSSFFIIVAGTVCGIVALFGISRTGPHKVLVPGIVGTVLNGLMLSLFVIGFVRGYNEARQSTQAHARPAYAEIPVKTQPSTNRFASTTHLGTWETRTAKGEPMTWTFSPTEFTLVNPTGNISFPYEIEYAMNPVWLTIRADKPRRTSMLMMIEFVGNGKMRVTGSNPGADARPVDFGTEPSDVLIFNKRP